MSYPLQITDDAGRSLTLKQKPKRIICLVPSITEIVAYITDEESVVACTNYCKYPESLVAYLPKIGGTQHVHVSEIEALQPDLVIANKDENLKQDIAKLETFVPVYVTHVRNFEESVLMVHTLGKLLDCQERAKELALNLFNKMNSIPIMLKKVDVLYLLWRSPYISVNKNTYTGSILEKLNFRNITAHESKNYPDFTLDQLSTLKPKFILLASEPYTFSPKHELELEFIFPDAHILHVDGEIFSWYGMRVLEKPNYLAELIDIMETKFISQTKNPF